MDAHGPRNEQNNHVVENDLILEDVNEVDRVVNQPPPPPANVTCRHTSQTRAITTAKNVRQDKGKTQHYANSPNEYRSSSEAHCEIYFDAMLSAPPLIDFIDSRAIHRLNS
ncbi:unnamed protein product [Clavelina lepadiformis]|uniref:Uncharacterized protein n=1 Tax=Clavelina lepadiformis TaxID=159417 RepID=A0ABP0GT16_CLALP